MRNWNPARDKLRKSSRSWMKEISTGLKRRIINLSRRNPRMKATRKLNKGRKTQISLGKLRELERFKNRETKRN